MARYLGPRFKVLRRLGKLPGLGQLKNTQDKARPKKISQYGKRLQEKQKVRYNYGLGEAQLINAVRKARKGSNLLQTLEMRLDCILFRAGIASTIPGARQLVNHGHILVNEKIVDIPSYQTKINDVISLGANKVDNISHNLPSHLRFQTNSTLIIKSFANRNQINLDVEELLIIEYYSRRI